MRTKPTRILQKTVATLLTLVTVAAIGAIALGCDSQQVTTVSANEISGHGQVPPEMTESLVQDILSYSFSDMSLVRSTKISGEEGDKSIEIEAYRPADWGDATFAGAISTVIYKTLPPLFQYPEVSKVVVTIYGVDQGVKSDEVACRLMVDRETANEINWSMVGPMSLSYYLTEYYVHPKIEANSSYSGRGIPGE